MTLAGVSSKAGFTLTDKSFGGVNAAPSTSTRDLQAVGILRERTFIPRLHDQAIIKQTSSKHRADIEQTSSKRPANIEPACRVNGVLHKHMCTMLIS